MWRTLAPNPVRYGSFLSFSRGDAYPKDWMQCPVNLPPFPLFLSGMCGGSQRESWGSGDPKSADIFYQGWDSSRLTQYIVHTVWQIVGLLDNFCNVIQ